jgi:hypothetical protein
LTASPSSAPPATASTSPIALGSAPPPPATAAPGSGRFSVCTTAGSKPACALAPATYTAAVHDPFHFSIAEAGWQEEAAVAGEDETRVILSRVDDAALRVSFLSGDTTLASPAKVDPAAFAIRGFKAGKPTDVTFAGTAAQSIDLEPDGATKASAIHIESQTIRIEPDRRYRFTIAKIPMDQEAATFIVVTEAPPDRFETFLGTAGQLLETVGFG